MTAAVPAPARSLPRSAGERRGLAADVSGAGFALLLVVAGLAVASPLIGVTGPLVIALIVAEQRRRRRWRAELARADALPQAVDHLLQRVRAGASLAQACRSLRDGPGAKPVGVGRPATERGGPHLGDLEPLLGAMSRGVTLVEASRALGAQPDPSVRLLATTLRMLATNGGPAVPALHRLRHTLVGRSHRHRRAQAQAASALSSAGLLVLAPAAFAAVLAGIEPELARFYLQEPAGAACATGSILLSALGWWWIHRLVGRFRVVDR